MLIDEMHQKFDLSTPEAVHRQFQRAINSINIDDLLALYEDQASLVLSDGRILSGLQEIKDHFSKLLKASPKMEIQKPTTLLSDGLAVLIADWRLSGILGDGACFEELGRTYDVVRRQGDGTWRIVFDSPWGAS